MKEIKIKYFSNDYEKLERIEGKKSDWIDLRVDSVKSQTRWEPEVVDIDEYNGVELVEYWHDTPVSPKSQKIRYVAGDILFLGLGVAMELPEGYEAVVAPRSSTFKNTGLILTNSIGVIDESYCGDTDEWKAVVYCTRDGMIKRHDRLFQFRIQKSQPELKFTEVKQLGNKDRGGYGSTGRD